MSTAANAIQNLLQSPLEASLFGPNSRYAEVGLAEYFDNQGRRCLYLKRRFVPPPESIPTATLHRVKDRERSDTLAASYLGDPELFWRLCDANGVMEDDELEQIGEIIKIPFPMGLLG
jgi:hypothetical protein